MTGPRITIVNAATVPSGPTGPGRTFPPLGPLYLTAALEMHGCRVDFRDYLVSDHPDPPTIDHFCRFLDAPAPLLAVGGYAAMLPYIVYATRAAKERNPELTIILGNLGPSEVAYELMEAFPHIDFVIRGEAEETLVELLDTLETGRFEEVRGLCFRTQGVVVLNPPRPRIRDLDALPIPAYDRIDFDRYSRGMIVTSRGCPYDCSFCGVPEYWHRRYETRSVDNVLDEIQVLDRAHGVDRVFLADDTFVLQRDRVLEFTDKLAERGVPLKWQCWARVDLVDESLLQAMAAAGCTRVIYGVEAGSESVLRQFRKGFTPRSAQEAVRLTLTYMEAWTTFIFGVPFETMDDMEATLRLMLWVELAGFGSETDLMPCAPLLSSQLCRQYREHLVYRDAGVEPAVREMVLQHPDVFAGSFSYAFSSLPEKERRLGRMQAAFEALLAKTALDADYRRYVYDRPRQTFVELFPRQATEELIGYVKAVKFCMHVRGHGLWERFASQMREWAGDSWQFRSP